MRSRLSDGNISAHYINMVRLQATLFPAHHGTNFDWRSRCQLARGQAGHGTLSFLFAVTPFGGSVNRFVLLARSDGTNFRPLSKLDTIECAAGLFGAFSTRRERH